MKVAAWPSSSHMMPKQLTQDELASQIPCQAVIITFVLQGAGPSSGADLLCCQYALPSSSDVLAACVSFP